MTDGEQTGEVGGLERRLLDRDKYDLESGLYFNGVETYMTILTLDVYHSAKTRKILRNKGYDDDKLIETLREKWERVYEHYHGIWVKDVGDEAIVALGLREKSKERQAELAVLCAIDLHKVTENATFDYLVDGISAKLNIPREQVYRYMTTKKGEWDTDIDKIRWTDVDNEYSLMEGLIGNKLQIKVGISNGSGKPKIKRSGREIDGEVMDDAHRVLAVAGPGDTNVTPEVLEIIKDRFYHESRETVDVKDKAEDIKKLKEYEKLVYKITGVKRYDTYNLANLAPEGSNWHNQFRQFRILTKDALRLIEHYQKGEAYDPKTKKHYEYPKQNLVLPTFEGRSKYYADHSLLVANLSYALAEAMVQQGTLDKGLYEAYRVKLGITALLLNIGLWQGSEGISGTFKESPKHISPDLVDLFKVRKARLGTIEVAHCDALREMYFIDSFTRFQHARYDGTGETAHAYRYKPEFATNLDPLFKETLIGDDIPFVIRITKAAGAYVEYLSDRAKKLRPKFAEDLKDPYEFARIGLEYIKQDEGKRFDPKVVKALEYLLQPAAA